MVQKINLLLDLPKWEKTQYPLNFVIGLNIVLIILLMGFYTLFYLEFKTKDRIFNGILYQYHTANHQLTSLQKQVINTGKKEKEDTEYKIYLYNELEGNAANGTKNYYDILEDLGAKINPGVWLSHINIKKYASEISLTGYTIQPQNAMNYVSSLNKSHLLNNTILKLENIRNVSTKNYLFIQIASTKINNKKGGAKSS